MALELDLDVDAGCELELHQRVDGLGRRIEDVDQTPVSTDLELLSPPSKLRLGSIHEFPFKHAP